MSTLHDERKDEGKYIGEYPVPVRMVADRMSMRGTVENHDVAFIEEQMKVYADHILSTYKKELREEVSSKSTPTLVSSDDQAYEYGKDAALNGANSENSNFIIFTSPEMRDAWQRGYDEVLKMNPSKRAL